MNKTSYHFLANIPDLRSLECFVYIIIAPEQSSYRHQVLQEKARYYIMHAAGHACCKNNKYSS